MSRDLVGPESALGCVMAARNCAAPHCGRAYEQKTPSHRYCSATCRQRAKRAGVSVSESSTSNGTGPVASQTRTDLATLDQLETTEGQVALALAGLLDEQKGAMGAAGTADRLLKIMDALRKQRPAAKTPLDLMRERRARRGA